MFCQNSVSRKFGPTMLFNVQKYRNSENGRTCICLSRCSCYSCSVLTCKLCSHVLIILNTITSQRQFLIQLTKPKLPKLPRLLHGGGISTLRLGIQIGWHLPRLQVFVANPNKPQSIIDILINNKEKQLKNLEEFHTDKGASTLLLYGANESVM